MEKSSNHVIIDRLCSILEVSNRLDWNIPLEKYHPLRELIYHCAIRGLYPRDAPPPKVAQFDPKDMIETDSEVDRNQFDWLMFWSCFGMWGYHSYFAEGAGRFGASPDVMFHWVYTISSSSFSEWDSWYNERVSMNDDEDDEEPTDDTDF